MMDIDKPAAEPAGGESQSEDCRVQNEPDSDNPQSSAAEPAGQLSDLTWLSAMIRFGGGDRPRVAIRILADHKVNALLVIRQLQEHVALVKMMSGIVNLPNVWRLMWVAEACDGHEVRDGLVVRPPPVMPACTCNSSEGEYHKPHCAIVRAIRGQSADGGPTANWREGAK